MMLLNTIQIYAYECHVYQFQLDSATSKNTGFQRKKAERGNPGWSSSSAPCSPQGPKTQALSSSLLVASEYGP